MTGGLHAKLVLAVVAIAILHRNINTKAGLVNEALGTVVDITANHMSVWFDHMTEPYKVEKKGKDS